MAKDGQMLVERIEAYIGRYVSFPAELRGQALVMALWAIHTWMYERFPATPYLMITASVKQAGKTLCMEVLALICRQAHVMATLRPLAMLRVIDVHDGRCTIGVDEAEKLKSGAVGDLRSIFTTGYTQGGEHYITVKTREYIRFKTYCPKMFALIGDCMDVVRDRAIVTHLRRSEPSADFRADRSIAAVEAQSIVAAILDYFAGMNDVPLVQPSFLSGREREIWAPIFSIASAMGLNKAAIERLTATAMDLSGLKSAEARSFFSDESETEASDRTMGERAIKDLRRVLRDGEPAVFSAVAVERMKGLADGPWRTYKGVGLTADMLAALVSAFGVQSKNVRMERGRKAKMLKGYSARDVNASCEREGR